MPLLSVRDLTVHYRTVRGMVRALELVSFDLDQGEALGLVGESGCGKTTLAMSLMGLLSQNAVTVGGEILFKGLPLPLGGTERQWRKVRWDSISMIFQGAMNTLNPVQRVGDQIKEALFTHMDMSEAQANARVEELYRLVDLDPGRSRDFPHQYSGGMKQRAVIAMALACYPDLVIADEPTTALDVMVQHQILTEINRLQESLHMSLIYISHDISIIAETCDHVGVMYAGSLVELADTLSLFDEPLHPYTRGLLSSYPSLIGEKKRLNPIPGEPPNLLSLSDGCRFWARCPMREIKCREKAPAWGEVKPGHFVRCHLVDVRKHVG